jgi:hypothetical protein
VRRAGLVVLLLSLSPVACDQAHPTLQVVDAGPVTKTVAACQPEDGETCGACMAQMGTCCYGDASIGGLAPLLQQRCEGMPSCRACCNECAAKTCDQWAASGDCPNQ